MPSISDLPVDILRLILESSSGDRATLQSASLVSHTWRSHTLPVLLRHVDLSCHNEAYLPAYARSPMHPRFLDLSDDEEPRNPSDKQISFLRLVLEQPDLALLVQSLAWTLVWSDEMEGDHTNLEMRTWEAFSLMRNVKKLDLAAIHVNGELLYARRNPDSLFPAVQELRLGGWLHRRLVKALVGSLDASKLVALHLDHLQDEGAWHSGEPLPDFAVENSARPWNGPRMSKGISDELWERQERGEAAYLPGPMWYPLKLLSKYQLASLTHLTVEMCPPADSCDKRNEFTMFREIGNIISSARDTLESISLSLGEHPELHPAPNSGPRSNVNMAANRAMRAMSFNIASAFLHCILPTLTNNQFPRLKKVDLRGFRIIKTETSRLPLDFAGAADPETTWSYIDLCPFVDRSITETENVDYYNTFKGYDATFIELTGEKLAEAEEILQAGIDAD